MSSQFPSLTDEFIQRSPNIDIEFLPLKLSAMLFLDHRSASGLPYWCQTLTREYVSHRRCLYCFPCYLIKLSSFDWNLTRSFSLAFGPKCKEMSLSKLRSVEMSDLFRQNDSEKQITWIWMYCGCALNNTPNTCFLWNKERSPNILLLMLFIFQMFIDVFLMPNLFVLVCCALFYFVFCFCLIGIT